MELYQALLDLDRDCMAAGSVEASHGVLSAALHCASDAGNLDAVSELRRLAEARQAMLDAMKPAHPLSTRQARQHGMNPVFTILATTANAVHTRLRAEEARLRSEASRDRR
jgi:hypothetical protein